MQLSDVEALLLKFEPDATVSDFHICVGEHISYRKLGDITFIEDMPKVTHLDMEMIIKGLLEKHPGWFEKLTDNRELDFNFYSQSKTPYRVNAYFKMENLGLAMRKINYEPVPLEVLMYEDIANTVKEHILNQKTGLFLVCGPTGSGKTTSLIAMIEYINEHRKEHIITIEDPIEYVFTEKNCLISQRALGSDTLSFARAMRSAMRQDPDVIFVGEIRDPETAEAAINLAETGHLVFSTLHTRGAANTVNRLISFFPPEVQSSIKDRLSDSLLGVQSQFLLKTSDDTKRIGMYELMINTPAIRNNIRKDDGKQIDSIIGTSRGMGMISHMDYAKRLIEDGKIDRQTVDWLFS